MNQFKESSREHDEVVHIAGEEEVYPTHVFVCKPEEIRNKIYLVIPGIYVFGLNVFFCNFLPFSFCIFSFSFLFFFFNFN